MTTILFGYLDPGSGSMLLQLLLGGFAAIGVGAKLYWRRLLAFLRIRRDDDATPPVASKSPPTE
jgi:hypothetical protein